MDGGNVVDELIRIQPEQVDRLSTILINAYPGLSINTPEKTEQFKERILRTQSENATVSYYGLVRDGELVGGMRFHDFKMTMLTQTVQAGGVGFVAVDFMRKKERIGKELIYNFLKHYDAKGASVALLYAFRTDFYQQMGFGFGGQMHQYQIPTNRLPKGSSRSHIHMLTNDDIGAFRDYYHRLVARTHGMIEKTETEINAMFKNPNQRIVAYKAASDIEGFILFSFKPHNPTNFGSNDIVITEMFHDHPEALSELFTFLHSQADQIRSVIINTQDDDFYHLIPDARNGSDAVIPHVYHETHTSGVGLMYRVIDTKRLFYDLRHHNFNDVTCTVKLNIIDDFYASNQGSTVVRFVNGFPQVQPDGVEVDVEVSMHVSDFSSLVMGVVPFITLVRYGRVEISHPSYTRQLHRLFDYERPVCTAGF